MRRLIKRPQVLLLTAALLALGASGPASAQAKDIVLRPPLPTNRVVIFFHGAGGYASNIEVEPSRAVVDILLRRGFAVAASDAHGPENWGNPASVADNEHLVHRLGYERVFLWGGSMGSLDAMQVLSHVHPEAVALVSPVCDISALIPQMDPGISMAWGESRPAYLSPVVPHPYPGLRVSIWASPEDTWVPKARNADACARELRNRGAIVREFATTGQHTNLHMVKNRSIPDFFSAVARSNPAFLAAQFRDLQQ